MKRINVLLKPLCLVGRVTIGELSAVFALITFGCVMPSPGGVPAPNAPPGRIGLAYGGSLPQFDLQIPDSRSEAAEDHAVRTGWSWGRDLHEGCVYNELDAIGVYIRMGLTPVGMLGGAAYGAFAGESKHELERALFALTNAMTQLQVQEALHQKLLFLIQQKSARPVALMTNSFPAETAFRVPSLMDIYAPLPDDARSNSECSPSAFEGVDTLVMIRAINHGLSGPDRPNPPLTLNLAVRVTLIRAQDRTQLAGFYAQYDSPPRKFVDWAGLGAQPFRIEFERGLQTLAEQIVAQSGLQLPQPIGIVQNVVDRGANDENR
jgi:hypothetical protein